MKKSKWIGLGLILALFWSWYMAIFQLTTEVNQGEFYRILYIHVPSAFAAFFVSFILFIFSVLGLIKKTPSLERYGKATAEIGFFLTLLCLATGSIWGRPTWGVWWTWDARLTTTFILALLYAGYLLLWNSLPSGPGRIKSCSILGIFIFVDVPIIYKSVTWWRTLHQPPSLMREGGSTMSPEIYNHLVLCIVLLICFSVWLLRERAKNLQISDDIEKHSYQALVVEEDS